MRKASKPSKPEKASFSVKKILIITLISFVIMGMMGVMATNVQVKNVKIILSSGYEKNVVTTNTKVSEILKENNIVLSDGETTTPALDEEISDNKTITITLGEVEKKSAESYFSEEEILQSYKEIVEKVVTVQEEIPFETETRDVSNGSESTQDRVVQAGSNGLKEITYRIKYQNGEEIEKETISENIIEEPVNKIVEVRTKAVTSRSGNSTRASSGSAADAQAYAYQRCMAYGWSENDFDCLVKLWNKESGWNVYAKNSSSGAYGIPQALPGSKMASAGSDYLNSYETQVDWGLSYIKGRYGSPSSAWSHSVSTGWY